MKEEENQPETNKMLCQDCHKKEATVRVTREIDKQKIDLHLCAECAEKRGFRNPLEGVPFPLAEFLSGMLVQSKTKKTEKTAEERCSVCGMSFSDFSKVGRLGCGNCYLTFRGQLNDLLRKVHGSTTHRGKSPHSGKDVMRPLWEESKLHEELKRAIQDEDFEKAAELRDRIKALAGKQ
jgi:protein arginine kinase activator